MTASLDARASSERALLTERAVGEPVLALFAYSTLKASATATASAAAASAAAAMRLPPRVSFGPRTGGDVLSVGQASAARLGDVREGRPALHAVVEAADPKTAIRVARTLFLSHGGAVACGTPKALTAPSILDDDEEEEGAKDLPAATDADVAALAALYLALAAGTDAGIMAFSAAGGSAAAAEAAAKAALSAGAAAHAGAAALLQAAGGAGKALSFELLEGDGFGGLLPEPRRGSHALKARSAAGARALRTGLPPPYSFPLISEQLYSFCFAYGNSAAVRVRGGASHGLFCHC